jgi:DNA-binding transcriptional regulator YbjK
VSHTGFAGLTYRAVAAEAGVTYGLVTYHFGSLDAMMGEALVLASRESMERSRITLAGGDVGTFAAKLAALVSDDPDTLALLYEMALEARRRPKLLGHIRAGYDSYFDDVGRSLASIGLDHDPQLAHLVGAALDGLIIQQLVFSDSDRTDASLRLLHEILDNLRHARPGCREARHS